MQKSDNHLDADMPMIRIQALEWVQGQIQDLILNNVTTDWPVYNYEQMRLEKQLNGALRNLLLDETCGIPTI